MIDFQFHSHLLRVRNSVGIGSDLADQRAAKIDIGASEQAAGVGKHDGEIVRRLEKIGHFTQEKNNPTNESYSQKEEYSH